MSGGIIIPGAPPPPPPGETAADRHLRVLLFAAQNYPEAVSIADARAILVGGARGNDQQEVPGRIDLQVSDEIVRSLTGQPGKAKWKVLVVAINTEAVERAQSPIVLPGELGVGGVR